MRKTVAFGFGVMFAGLASLPADAGTFAVFAGDLSGAQEVPAVATTGSGSYTAALSCVGTLTDCTFTYTVEFSDLLAGIVNPPGAHIHNAPAGVNGPVVHVLDGLAGLVGATSGTFVGDWAFDDAVNPLTDTLAAALLAGNTYFNLHTSFSTPGEIRGQINAVPLPAAAVLALSGLGLIGLVAGNKARRNG